MEKMKDNKIILISGSVIIFAILICITTFLSAQNFSEQNSYVEVKGLSERIVKADTAIWSMSFEVKSNNVDSLYSDIEKNIVAIKSFLKEKGFEDTEVNIAPVNIYQDTYKDAAFRYNANNQISVYTKKVEQAKEASNNTLALMKKGIVLNQNNISFVFSDLNSIKPEMLKEAIKKRANNSFTIR